MTLAKPRISVVVASHNAQVSVQSCLKALETQKLEKDIEIIVVDNSTDGAAEIIQGRFPDIKLILKPPSMLIPELWGAGIRHSSGDIVAITTAHFVPKDDWITQILQAHEASVPAIGGAIENDESADIVDWAVYFCRYTRYMLPFSARFAPEIAGDNASYKRACIDQYDGSWRNGFWESSVHAELKKAGVPLLLTPSIVVYHKRSFGFWSFMRERFRHGKHFGKWRGSHVSRLKRMLYLVASPLIPFVLLLRIIREVLRTGRHKMQFLLSSPVLQLFLFSWSLGEFVGYLRAGAE